MPILQLLFLAFLAIPIAEIYLLIKVGHLIGPLPTIFLVVFTAVLGAMLVRFQGWQTMERVRESMARGEMPTVPMLEGAVVLVSGALLLTPGFITDTLGFLGLIPPLRRAVIRLVLSRMTVRAQHYGPGPGPGPGPASHHRPDVIEGDYERHDD